MRFFSRGKIYILILPVIINVITLRITRWDSALLRPVFCCVVLLVGSTSLSLLQSVNRRNSCFSEKFQFVIQF